MTADIDQIIERFGPPVAVVAGRHHEIRDAELRQHISGQTHIHARMHALLRLHLHYPKHITVSTLHDAGPDEEFDITWRVLAVVGDHFAYSGFEDLEQTRLTIGTHNYRATKGTVPNDVGLDLTGLVAHIPEEARSVVVIASPDQLDDIELNWR